MFHGDVVVVTPEVVLDRFLLRASRHNIVVKLAPLQRTGKEMYYMCVREVWCVVCVCVITCVRCGCVCVCVCVRRSRVCVTERWCVECVCLCEVQFCV